MVYELNFLDSGEVLEYWKTTKIMPLFKKGGRHKAEYYRAVGLTLALGKFENPLFVRLEQFENYTS